METFAGLLGIVPHVIILIASITLNSKRPSSDATMMLIGAVISLGVSSFYSVIMPLLVKAQGSYDSLTSYFGMISIIGTAGWLLFAIGLLLFVQKSVKS